VSDKPTTPEPEQPANTGVSVNCAFSEMAPVADLIHHPKNPNRHSDAQLKFIRKVIEHQGWRSPLVVSNLSGFVVCGNGRLMAARSMGLEVVPVDRQDFASEADEVAHMLADNKIAAMAENDNDLLKEVLLELDTGELDMDLTGFDSSELEDLMTQFHVEAPEDFPEVDENLETKHTCPKCGYKWSGGE
jgi:ParB-like chromosome segregation protein Spo0J